MSPASEHMKVGGRESGGGSVVMGRTMRMDLRFFWCLWLPLGRAAKLLSGRQCHVDVFIVCQWQLLLPPSPLPGTAVSELQLTHLSRIRLVGCACESFGGCRVPAEGGRGMCASGRVDYNCHAPVSDCLHLKMRRPLHTPSICLAPRFFAVASHVAYHF